MDPRQTASFGLWLGLFVTLFASSTFAAYEEVTVTNGATIRGSNKVQGQIPKLPPLQISKYKEVCRDVPNETLIVGPSQGLRYAVVTLEGIVKGRAVEREVQHELDNVKCRVAPHVQAASVGQFVLLKNADPILHTAHVCFASGQPDLDKGLRRRSYDPVTNPGTKLAS